MSATDFHDDDYKCLVDEQLADPDQHKFLGLKQVILIRKENNINIYITIYIGDLYKLYTCGWDVIDSVCVKKKIQYIIIYIISQFTTGT